MWVLRAFNRKTKNSDVLNHITYRKNIWGKKQVSDLTKQAQSHSDHSTNATKAKQQTEIAIQNPRPEKKEKLYPSLQESRRAVGPSACPWTSPFPWSQSNPVNRRRRRRRERLGFLNREKKREEQRPENPINPSAVASGLLLIFGQKIVRNLVRLIYTRDVW